MDSSPADVTTSVRRAGWELLAASSIVLFQELALIRWLPVEVRVAAYFPNLVLIGAFLGLGVGALRSGTRPLLWLWPVSLVALLGAARAMHGIAFTSSGMSEHLWLLYGDLPESAPVVNAIHVPLIILFVLTALSFVSLGQLVGERLELFRTASSALKGYAVDLGGSLLGVVGVALVSWAGLNPVFWLGPPLVLGFVLLGSSVRLRALHAVCLVVVLGLVFLTSGGKRFSPYYALETVSLPDGAHEIRANGSLHQVALDLVSEEGTRQRLTVLLGYRHPYQQLGRPIRKALVLGAGSGNDVATLLAMGAEEIHAVEIDPEILQIGREIHPNDPYADPRVTVHTTDARSFLNESPESFDVIVFGTLDSMTRLSAMSNVRLDNFVYTREGLEAAASRLTPDGGLVLYFMIGQEFIREHLLLMLTETFGAVPRVHQGDYSLFNTIFMAGPAYSTRAVSVEDAESYAEIMMPSDDWPYLYLPQPGISSFYLAMLAILATIGVLSVLLASPQMRHGLVRGGRGIDGEMFMYGFAFLLIETKFITSMNLLWGATWLTSAVVFGSILLVVLAGTLLTDRTLIPWRVSSTMLVLALLATYLLPLELLLSTSPTVRLGLSVLFVGTPVFFASLCFAVRFKARKAADVAFGWNLLGAVVGGLTEFFSMALGFRTLTLVAIVAYMTAFLLAGRERAARGVYESP